MSAILDKIKEEVKTLTPEELQQVRETVDSLLAKTYQPQMTEKEFAQVLASRGFISLPESAANENAISEFHNYRPITVSGQPLSEMIVEERR